MTTLSQSRFLCSWMMLIEGKLPPGTWLTNCCADHDNAVSLTTLDPHSWEATSHFLFVYVNRYIGQLLLFGPTLRALQCSTSCLSKSQLERPKNYPHPLVSACSLFMCESIQQALLKRCHKKTQIEFLYAFMHSLCSLCYDGCSSAFSHLALGRVLPTTAFSRLLPDGRSR